MRSFPLLAIAYGIAAVANFLLSVSVGRSLGAAALGYFALAVALTRIFYAATDLGLASHLTRVLSRDRGVARDRTALFVWVRAALVPLAIALAAVVGQVRSGNAVLFAGVALAQGIVSIQLLYEGLLLSHDRQRVAASLTGLASVAIGTGCALWYAARGSLAEFGAVYAVAVIAGFVPWVMWAGTRLHVWPRLRVATDQLRGELSQAWPIGASMLLGIVALRCPVLALGAFGSDADVGAYSAVDIFVTGAAIIQSAITNATFPRLSSSFRRDPDGFRRLFWASNLLLAGVGIGVAAFLILFGGRIALSVFPGRDFARISSIMPIVACSTPVLLLVHHNILIFAASDNERANLRLMLMWCAIIAAAQLALVPRFGLAGAAWGIVVGRGVGLAILAIALVKRGIHRGGDGRQL